MVLITKDVGHEVCGFSPHPPPHAPIPRRRPNRKTAMGSGYSFVYKAAVFTLFVDRYLNFFVLSLQCGGLPETHWRVMSDGCVEED